MPLAMVPIHGASDAELAVIRGELERFDLAIGEGRLRITGIWVRELRGDIDSRQFGRRVVLDPGVDLLPAMRRFLCTALLKEERLVHDPDPVLDDLAKGLFEPPYPQVFQRPRTPEGRRTMLVSRMCEMGPQGAAALVERCPADGPQAAEMGTWLLDHDFVAYEEPFPVEVDSTRMVTSQVPAAIGTRVFPTREPGVVALSGLGTPDFVDVWTGQAVEGVFEVLEAGGQGVPPGMTLTLHPPSATAGDLGGAHAMMGMVSDYHLSWPAAADRLFVHDTDGWRRVKDGCTLAGVYGGVFAADGHVWVKIGSMATPVRWVPLYP